MRAFISLCSVWSSLTPTWCSFLAGTSVQVPSPTRFPWTCRLPRLIWQVMFFRYVHIRGRISSTCMRKVWHLWTCICFSCLSRLLSAPMHNPTRKLPTRLRKETRGLVPSLWPGSPGKLTPRNIATCARSMGARIPCTTPRIVVGTS